MDANKILCYLRLCAFIRGQVSSFEFRRHPRTANEKPADPLAAFALTIGPPVRATSINRSIAHALPSAFRESTREKQAENVSFVALH
jgi:hypothetical protein